MYEYMCAYLFKKKEDFTMQHKTYCWLIYVYDASSTSQKCTVNIRYGTIKRASEKHLQNTKKISFHRTKTEQEIERKKKKKKWNGRRTN